MLPHALTAAPPHGDVGALGEGRRADAARGQHGGLHAAAIAVLLGRLTSTLGDGVGRRCFLPSKAVS